MPDKLMKTRECMQLITGLSRGRSLNVVGFLRDPNARGINFIVIAIDPPIKDEELEEV
jgi:hypothetical protein